MAFYNVIEYTDMVLVYGEAEYDAAMASRIYADRFPGRRIPDPRTIIQAVQWLRDNDRFNAVRVNAGMARIRRTVEMEEEVLALISENPELSTRKIARLMDTDHVTIWRILHDAELHPYHYTRVQQLHPRDFGPRVNFCE